MSPHNNFKFECRSPVHKRAPDKSIQNWESPIRTTFSSTLYPLLARREGKRQSIVASRLTQGKDSYQGRYASGGTEGLFPELSPTAKRSPNGLTSSFSPSSFSPSSSPKARSLPPQTNQKGGNPWLQAPFNSGARTLARSATLTSLALPNWK